MTNRTTRELPVWADVLGYWVPASPWRRRWAEARTAAAQGDLVAKWLEGDYRHTPGHMGPADDETAPLVPDLARLCRAGVVTTGSQPGATGTDEDGGAWVQRAYVVAYGEADTINPLARAAAAAGLWVTCNPHDVGDSVETMPAPPVPVTFDQETREPLMGLFPGRSNAWGGAAGIVWPAACRSVWEEATQLAIIDPEPGRERMLWDTLTAALDVEAAR